VTRPTAGASADAARPLAPSAARLTASATALIEERVAELRREGRTLYRLGMGEPDFPVPEHIRAAAIQAIRDDRSGYTETAGIRSLREAISERLAADLGVAYGAEEILSTNGAKQALAEAIAVLCAEGDEVLLPVPYWVSFPEQIRLAGAAPRLVHPGSPTAKVSADELEMAITPRTRLVILNSPNNPSGAVYDRAELGAIAELCGRHDLWVLSDEVYRAFVFGAARHTTIASLPGMRERTVFVDSVSKTYGMPGWRLGFAAGPREVVAAMGGLQSHLSSNPSTISQAAAEAALRGPQDEVEANRREYAGRAAFLTDRLAALPRLRCAAPPAGGFFAWVAIDGVIGRAIGGETVRDADSLAAAVLDASGVVLTPGTGFGSDGHVRLSVAAPRAELEAGLKRLAALIGDAEPTVERAGV
jgi:aspartate aminotransferase